MVGGACCSLPKTPTQPLSAIWASIRSPTFYADLSPWIKVIHFGTNRFLIYSYRLSTVTFAVGRTV